MKLDEKRKGPLGDLIYTCKKIETNTVIDHVTF